jgi:hypothetical protein
MDKFLEGFDNVSEGGYEYAYRHVLTWDNFTFPAIPRDVYEDITDKEGDGKSTVKLEAEITFKDKRDNTTLAKAVSLYSTYKHRFNLVPLFEMRDIYVDDTYPIANISNRKFGNLEYEDDKGSELWGRKAFLEWLKNDEHLIYNDLSSIHGARYYDRNNKYKSILEHDSHTSGVEVDIRYAEPIAGLSEPDNLSKPFDQLFKMGENPFTFANNSDYSGYNAVNNFRKLSNNAKKDTSEEKTNLNLFKDWIVTNRRMMEFYYDNLIQSFGNTTNIKIFYGQGLGSDEDDSKVNKEGFANMMEKGSFYDSATDNTTGVGIWKHAVIQKKAAHYDHWHITAPINSRLE